jgi:TatD DNase family protein
MPSINLWDAHAHIQPPWFSEDEISDLVEKSIHNSIKGIINVVSNPTEKDYSYGLGLAKKFDIIHTNFGLQPTEATNENFLIFKETIETKKNSICGIGELGLDYHWVTDKKLLALQKDIFKKCIEVANEVNLPLIIHSRKAETDCLNTLEKFAKVPVLMHGMEANDEHITRLIDLNYFITIPTSVCNRKKYMKIAKKTPLELILLETDAPFQLPFNAKPNERIKNSPANIMMAAKKIASIKELTLNDVAFTTTNNVETFFGI